MSEPTTTRQALRRAIGRTARMKFYLRYPDGSLQFTEGATTDDVSSTEAFYCNKLALWISFKPDNSILSDHYPAAC